MDFVIEFLLEDDGAVVVHDQKTGEIVVLIHHDEEVALALGDDFGVGAQSAVDGDSEDVSVNSLMPRQFAKRVLVFVACNPLRIQRLETLP